MFISIDSTETRSVQAFNSSSGTHTRVKGTDYLRFMATNELSDGQRLMYDNDLQRSRYQIIFQQISLFSI